MCLEIETAVTLHGTGCIVIRWKQEEGSEQNYVHV